jgi:hypothetical protein
MNIYFIILLIILIIILWILILQNRHHNIIKIIEEAGYSNYLHENQNYSKEKTNIDALNSCTVPTLNTEQCYKSRFYECPIVNGTYLQCTNNYIPKPNEYNADCGNRTFDMVPYPWKISENCYYNKINFNRVDKYA